MKKRLLLVYVFVAFVLLCTNVYAVISMNLTLVADKDSVKPGEKLEVTVNVKNISKPISSIKGYINVKEDVLGEFSKDMIVAEDGKIEVKSGDKTNKLSYAFNPDKLNADYDIIFNTKKNIENNDCLFLMDFKDDISASADILKFKFDIKENANVQTVKDALKVEITEVYSGDEKSDTEIVSATLDVKIEKKAEDPKPAEENKTEENKVDDNKNDDNGNGNNNSGNGSDNSGNSGNGNGNNGNAGTGNNGYGNEKNTARNNTNTNTNKNTNTNRNKVANNTNTDGTVSGNNIPAAGAGMLIVPVIIFIILAYISYNRYIKYKDI